jgi:hypothetical protein
MGKSVAAALVIASAIFATGSAAAASDRHARDAWTVGVARVCTGALLFEGRHSIGTARGAVAVARDIRASTARRLARIEELRAHPDRPLLASRWTRAEHRLSELYARNYLGIWRAIANANSRAERARLPRILTQMLNRPDRASARARLLEEQLGVPDCTGGDPAGAGGEVSGSPEPI